MSDLITLSGTVNAALTSLPTVESKYPSLIDPAGLVPSPLVLDSFTNALASVALAAHTPVYNPPAHPWVVLAGGFNVSGGLAIPTSTAENVAVIDADDYDVSIYAKVTLSNQDGIVFRATDNNNYFRAVGLVAGASSGTRGWYLYRKQAGAVTQLAFFNDTSLALGQVRDMHVDVRGTTVTLTVGGVQMFSYSTLAFNLTAESHGMVKKDNGSSALNPVDDFQIGA